MLLQNQPEKFLKQRNLSNHIGIYFNNIPVKMKNTQKHLWFFLDDQLISSEHINEDIE